MPFQLSCVLLMLFALTAGQKIDLEPHTQLIVDLHNEYRRREKASNMMYMGWDEKLAQEASAWTKRCKFLHQENEFGENIAYDINEAKPDKFLKRILRLWYDERMLYYRSPYGCGNSCHYTQMIWSDTSKVGCALSQCSTLLVWGQYVKNAFYLVCYYSPRGNWIGQYPFLTGTSCSRCRRGHWCNKGLCKKTESVRYSKALTKTAIKTDYTSGHTADEAVRAKSGPKSGPMSGRQTIEEKYGAVQADSGCEDLQKVLCRAWAEQGECDRNRDAMTHYCKKSCGHCPRDNGDVTGQGSEAAVSDDFSQNDEQCDDIYESRQCQIWATVGECELNPVSMEHYCKRSCGLCNPMARGFGMDSTIDAIDNAIKYDNIVKDDTKVVKKKNKKHKKCRDQFTKKKCKNLYKMGFCKVRHLEKWMRSHCEKTCGLCSKRKYRTGEVLHRCRDNRKVSKCQRLKEKGYCVAKKKKMRRKCAHTCGLCDEEPTLRITLTDSEE